MNVQPIRNTPPPAVAPARKRPRKRNRAQLSPIPWGKPDRELGEALCKDWVRPMVRLQSMRALFAWTFVGGLVLLGVGTLVATASL